MKRGVKRGLGFGITSGIITTLGVLIGLYSSTHSKLVMFGGILSVAIADAFSDALGIHVSEESAGKGSHKAIWRSTFATFLSKLFMAGFFIIPLLVFEIRIAVLVSMFFGLFVLGLFSYRIAIKRKDNPFRTIGEHVFIAILVIVITYFVGELIEGLNFNFSFLPIL